MGEVSLSSIAVKPEEKEALASMVASSGERSIYTHIKNLVLKDIDNWRKRGAGGISEIGLDAKYLIKGSGSHGEENLLLGAQGGWRDYLGEFKAPEGQDLRNLKESILERLHDQRTYGNIPKACFMCKVPYGEFKKWVAEDDWLREKLEEVEEWWLSAIEERYRERLVGPKADSIGTIFYLKSKARHHGYVDYTSNMSVSGNNIQLVIKGNEKEPKKLF